MNPNDEGLIVALLHEVSSLKARVAAMQSLCMDLMLERNADKEEAFRKSEHIYEQIEAGARKSVAIRVRKHCPDVDDKTLKKWGLI